MKVVYHKAPNNNLVNFSLVTLEEVSYKEYEDKINYKNYNVKDHHNESNVDTTMNKPTSLVCLCRRNPHNYDAIAKGSCKEQPSSCVDVSQISTKKNKLMLSSIRIL